MIGKFFRKMIRFQSRTCATSTLTLWQIWPPSKQQSRNSVGSMAMCLFLRKTKMLSKHSLLLSFRPTMKMESEMENLDGASFAEPKLTSIAKIKECLFVAIIVKRLISIKHVDRILSLE